MTYLDVRFINFNAYFSQSVDTFIFQLPLFHTGGDKVNSYNITTALFIHFLSVYMRTFKLGIECCDSVF